MLNNILNFDSQILQIFGIEAEYNSHFLQWEYTFKNKDFILKFVYDIDKTISASLYFQGNLIVFCFANNLENLFIYDNKIHAKCVSKSAIKDIEIDPIHSTIQWRDTFI